MTRAFFLSLSFFFNLFSLIRSGERGGERDTDVRNIDQLLLACAPTGDQTHNPDMCPDGELIPRPFDLQHEA